MAIYLKKNNNMKKYIFTLLGLFFLASLFCFNSSLNAQDYNDDRTYEIRYWQSMTDPGSNPVLIDTMVYSGLDRTGFDYSSADCISHFCKEEDKKIYALMDQFTSGQSEWTIEEFFVRKIDMLEVPFRAKDRKIYHVYVSDHNNRNSGFGTYSLVSSEFGVICRYNSDGEFFQLNRIDVVKNQKTMEELNLLPIFEKLYASRFFK